MSLPPAQVRGVAFSKPPRGKRGYHEDEVDAFLDVVAAELARLLEEYTDLRNQLAQYDQQPPPSAIDTAAAPREPASPLIRLQHPAHAARAARIPRCLPTRSTIFSATTPPCRCLPRYAREDLTLAGFHINAGEQLALLIGAANRDPQRFTDPDSLDVTRPVPPHTCPSAAERIFAWAPPWLAPRRTSPSRLSWHCRVWSWRVKRRAGGRKSPCAVLRSYR